MLLAEALARRADLNTRMSQLAARAAQNALHQEGEAPAEDPLKMLEEHTRLAGELQELILRINTTNLAVELEPGLSMTAALAKRDVLRQQVKLRQDLASLGSQRVDRSTRSELRFVSAIDVPAMRVQADAQASELRNLDVRIQQANWGNELVA